MKPHTFQASDDDFHLDPSCDLCGENADHPIHELDGVAIGDAEDDEQLDHRLRAELSRAWKEAGFTPPDEPDSGFDVREPETVSDLFHGYTGRDLP